MGKGEETGAGAIYWFFKGELRVLFPGIGIPNSICFSPDGATAYYTDTAVNLLMRVACDPKTGLPRASRRCSSTSARTRAGLDGSVVDADGVLWNARWGGASLDAYSPEGKRIRSIAMPARQSSCPAFVGAEGRPHRGDVRLAGHGRRDAAATRKPARRSWSTSR